VASAKTFWLVKQEPEDYSWSAFLKDGRTAWTGVRSFPARIHLRAMKKGDPVLFYHSGSGKEIVGVAQVVKEAYPDPTADEGDWVCVDLAPVRSLDHPVTLPTIKGDPTFSGMLLLRQTRLSVMPLSREQFERVLDLGKGGG
jgi:predicted RNA-binding protein with PUA-like domain